MKKWFLIGIVLWCCLPFGMALASSASDKAAQADAINQLNSQINSLQQTINNDQGKKGQVAAELRTNKEKLAQLKQHLADLLQKFNSQQSMLTDLQNKQHSTLQTMHNQQATLDQQLKAFYMANMDQQSQGNFATASNQVDVYAAAVANADEQQLQQNQTALQQLNNQQQQVSQTQAMLKQSLVQQNASQLELSKTALNQQQTLQKIDLGLESENQKLNQLVTNRQNLQNLVTKIQKKQAEQHAKAVAAGSTSTKSSTVAEGFVARGQSFSSQQGNLYWPVKGKIITAYDAPLDQSGLKSTGVLLSAKNDRNVHAIYQGKVVFAGFLQGFGLLIIIDHGDGYISLYGHNNALYRKVGDVVSTHDLIAQVDNSSAEHASGLYFEIRHEGIPVDPGSWCRV